MKVAAFNAICPYEIGDRVVIIEKAGRSSNGYCLHTLHKNRGSDFFI